MHLPGSRRLKSLQLSQLLKRARGEMDLVSFLTEDDTGRQPDRPSIEQQITAYYMQHATAATGPLVFWKAAVTTDNVSILGSSAAAGHSR